ncbi:MAG: 1-deoxy-D-xylulose-5-phosphate reductoisomerase [Deltaproteobacteria bacterium]|nr:1-deoxy-D-xylulose-5-phosphate reductoisomerase [Deltaproteobacteria bacterium]
MLVPIVSNKHQDFSYPRKVIVAGSTGSIGKSTLEIIKNNPEKFELFAISAHSNLALLEQQIVEHSPKYAVVTDAGAQNQFKSKHTEILSGMQELCSLCTEGIVDTVVAGIVGIAGLTPVLAALKANKRVALANKESLVAGGVLVREIIESGSGEIIPVDSEHSAIFQCLQGENVENLKSIILTASGGPFLGKSLDELGSVTSEMAIAHPNWSMGAKISVDSATMMNKALEVIEARWLYNLPEEQIEVLIHPESIVHSLVNFYDGSQIAQLSVPDMKGAIAYALSYPNGRLREVVTELSLARIGSLNFESVDHQRFPALGLARRCLKAGAATSAVFNIANELAVDAFLKGTIGFLDIVPVVEEALTICDVQEYRTLDELLALNEDVRTVLKERLFRKE